MLLLFCDVSDNILLLCVVISFAGFRWIRCSDMTSSITVTPLPLIAKFTVELFFTNDWFYYGIIYIQVYIYIYTGIYIYNVKSVLKCLAKNLLNLAIHFSIQSMDSKFTQISNAYIPL